jgi:hypothetical protein
VAHSQLRQRLGGIGLLVLIALLLASVTQAAAQPGPCHLYTSSSAPTPFQAGSGVPWNVLNPSELLLQAWCTNTDTTAYIGPVTYVYHQGYAWDGSNWQTLQLTCTGGAKVSDVWCPNSAPGALPATANASYYVAYTCNWTGSQWMCGCRDQTCAQSLWQLQGIQP